MPKIIIENSPEAPEPTQEEIQQSMKEPQFKPVEEVVPLKEEKVQEIPKLKDVDVTPRIKVGGQAYSEAELAEIIAQRKKPITNLPDATEPSVPGMMLVGNCYVKTSKVGTTVPLLRVTPAEVMFLSAEHHAEAGGNPIKDMEIVGEVKRTARDEINRLGEKYNVSKLKSMFPGAIPQLPTSFRQAVEIGTNTQLPEARLTEVDLARKG